VPRLPDGDPGTYLRWARRFTAAALSYALAGSSLLAAIHAVRLGLAGWLGSSARSDALLWSLRLTPEDPSTWLQLASRDRARQEELLQRALRENPWLTPARLRLALARELRGELSAAEMELQEAARRDRRFLPEWTLANFYFRHGPESQFWWHAGRAAQLAPRFPSALYRLCWLRRQDAQWLLRYVVPQTPQAQAEFLWWLARQGQLQAAGEVVTEVLRRAQPASTPYLLSYCELALRSGEVERALEVWNGLARRGLLAYAVLDPDRHVLTNGDFLQQPLSQGFDWRLQNYPGMAISWMPGELRVSLQAGPGRRYVAWTQLLAVRPSKSYRMRCFYTARGEGWRWVVKDQLAQRILVVQPLATGDGSGQCEFPWVVPAGCRLVQLALEYSAGDRPESGLASLALRRVEVEPQP